MNGISDKPRLGELLLDLGLLNREQLGRALEEQCADHERIGETLVRLGLVDRGQLFRALVEQRRRWLAASFGAAMMAIQPVAAMGRTATGQLSVTVQVDDTAIVGAPSAVVAVKGVDTAALSLSCAPSTSMQVTVGSAHVEPAAATAASRYVAAAPRYRLTMSPISSRTIACAPDGQPVSVTVFAPASKTAHGEHLNVEIAY
jgi:hypothetical protein